MGHVALKFDVTKAYNIIGLIFPGKGWRAMGFESKWVDLTMNCIKAVLYLALMNGEQFGYFLPGRGVHPGAPLFSQLSYYMRKG